MVKMRWFSWLAYTVGGLTAVAVIGCPQFPDYPPTIRSGPGGALIEGVESEEGGAPVDAETPESDAEDDGPVNYVCIYETPLPSNNTVFFTECEAYLDANGAEAAQLCKAKNGQHIAECPQTATTPVAGALAGCCTEPGGGDYYCVYAPETASAATAACKASSPTAVPSTSIPPL